MKLFFICFFLLPVALFAQRYNFSAGIKVDNEFMAITCQKRIADKTTLEAMIPFTKNDISLVLFAKQHHNIIGKRLNFYTGAGLHLANNYQGYNYAGIDALFGSEYTFFFIPYTIAFDFRPFVDFKSSSAKFYLQSGLSIRYIIKGRDTLKDKLKKMIQDKTWRELEF